MLQIWGNIPATQRWLKNRMKSADSFPNHLGTVCGCDACPQGQGLQAAALGQGRVDTSYSSLYNSCLIWIGSRICTLKRHLVVSNRLTYFFLMPPSPSKNDLELNEHTSSKTSYTKPRRGLEVKRRKSTSLSCCPLPDALWWRSHAGCTVLQVTSHSDLITSLLSFSQKTAWLLEVRGQAL